MASHAKDKHFYAVPPHDDSFPKFYGFFVRSVGYALHKFVVNLGFPPLVAEAVATLRDGLDRGELAREGALPGALRLGFAGTSAALALAFRHYFDWPGG